jgi:hypothetical protein
LFKLKLFFKKGFEDLDAENKDDKYEEYEDEDDDDNQDDN